MEQLDASCRRAPALRVVCGAGHLDLLPQVYCEQSLKERHLQAACLTADYRSLGYAMASGRGVRLVWKLPSPVEGCAERRTARPQVRGWYHARPG